MDWTTKFQSLSADVTASFGVDPYDDVIGDEYDDVIGASTLEVTTSPTPRAPLTFDLSKVPAPLFVTESGGSSICRFARFRIIAMTAYEVPSR